MTVNTYDATPSMTAGIVDARSGAHRELHAAPRVISLRFEVLMRVVIDAMVAALAVLCGLGVRFGDDTTTTISGVSYLTVAAVFPVLWVTAMALGGAYDRRFLAEGWDEYRRALNAAVWLGAAVAVSSFMLHLNLSRGLVGLTVPLAILLTLVCRHVIRKGLQRHLAAGAAIHRVLVVGSSASAERLVRHMGRTAFAGYAVVGVASSLPYGNADDHRTLSAQAAATVEQLVAEVRRLGADTIALASGDALGPTGIQRLSWQLEGTGIKLMVAPNVAEVAGPRIMVRPLAGLPLLHIEEPEFHGAERVVKECIDRLGAGLLLLLLSPVVGAIALVSLLAQGRPILYRQSRVGREGITFVIHKFRTMDNGADRDRDRIAHLNVHDGQLFKIREDPRVTRLGRHLRRFSLDELPQLWDVVRGSMSLVGPRPPLASEVKHYGAEAQRRLLVKPGITGLWQVSGRSDLSWEETVRLDLHYVENWSVALDLMLLWKTVFAVVRSKGAY